MNMNITNRVSEELSDFPTRLDAFNKSDWIFEQSIYKGNNATVYKIRHTRLHVSGVLKKYSKLYLNISNIEKIKKIFDTEVKCIKLLHESKYTPPLWYYYENTTEMGLIMKYMEQHTLRKYIHSFSCQDCAMASVIYPLLKAVCNIHSLGVIHRDIKPENIFIHKNHIYVGDYGYSHIFGNDINARGIVGTLQYMSPEILKAYLDNNEKVEYSKEVDIWAIGILTYELLYHTKPFGWNEYKTSNIDLRILIMKCMSNNLRFPRIISNEANDFIAQCLHKNPAMRPSIEELLHHEWVLNYLKDKDHINEKCHRKSFLSIQTQTPNQSQALSMKRQIQTPKVIRKFLYRSLETKKTPFWKKMICTIS